MAEKQGLRARPVCRCEHEEQGFSRSLLADAILDELPPATPEGAGASHEKSCRDRNVSKHACSQLDSAPVRYRFKLEY